ncbi:hypothetical protein [Flammeovirga pectinis]|nr:hypothetical protein [Flammeovirga pectinis]
MLLSIVTFMLSCSATLKPRLELRNNDEVYLEGIQYNYSQIDSAITSFANNLSTEEKQQVIIELDIDQSVLMDKVFIIRKSLKSNDLIKVNFID